MTADSPVSFASLLPGIGFAMLSDRAYLRMTGTDATRWLNGMVTNSIQAMEPGEGSYNFLLNAQGRIQGDCLIYRDTEVDAAEFLLETDARQMETIQPQLDRFIIMDDVELAPAFTDEPTILLLGLSRGSFSELLRDLRLPVLGPLRLARLSLPGGEAVLTTPAKGPLLQAFLRCPATVAQTLVDQLQRRSVQLVNAAALEQLRVLEGRPLFGKDIRDRDLPQETNQTQALHFSKGCYLGQEIVERIRSRGQVHRVFTPFRLEGALPESLPTPLEANGKPAGELTSIATVPGPEGDALLALGYGRRELLEGGADLTYPGGTAHPRRIGELTELGEARSA